MRKPFARHVLAERSRRAGRKGAAGRRVCHSAYGRLVEKLEAVVAARCKDFHELRSETAIFDADIQWKQVGAAQLLNVQIDAFDIDFQVMGAPKSSTMLEKVTHRMLISL